MKKTRLEALRDHAAQQWPYALVAVALWCAMLPLGATRSPVAPAATKAQAEWPTSWRGQALRPLARSAVEQRFAAQFPGRLARFALADGSELVLREVQRPTRMLHPAADCWRGIGWRIEATRLARDDESLLWRCFEAVNAGRRVRVCERIVDARGQSFTDTSAWFWAASLQHSPGPWQAITKVENLL
jgi:hypothetical protein